MRRIRNFVAAIALSASLAACSQGSGAVGPIDVDPKGIEAHITKLVGETLKGKATEAVSLDGIKAMLPPDVALTWGNLSFDAATNATVVTDMKLTPKDMPTVGVQISELRLWDLDIALLQDRIKGQRLSETAPLARRIDAKGVSLFGLADMINSQTQGFSIPSDPPIAVDPSAPVEPPANPTKFNQPTDPTEPQAPVEISPEDFGPLEDIFDSSEPLMSVERYDVSIGRIVVDDVVLKPYQVPAASTAAANPDPYDPFATLMPVLQQLAAISQSYGVDTAAYLDFKVGFAMTEMGQKMAGDMSVAAMGARGLRGGDVDGMFMRDLKYVATGDMGTGQPIAFDYSLGNMTLEDMRLEKVLGFLAKGVVPPRTESNLMSLGVWRSQNESMKLGGQEVYSVAESMFDATGWHWFIPSSIKASGKNVSLDIGALIRFGEQVASSAYGGLEDDPYYAEELANQKVAMQQTLAMLEKHGLSKPVLNYDAGWNWNAGNGETKLNFNLGGDGLLQVDTRYEGAFPSFKAVSDLIPEANPEAANMEAIQNVFQTNSSLKLIELNVQDKGGLEKIYGLVGEIMPAMSGGGQAMSAGDMRAMASMGVQQMAIMAGQQIPEIPTLLNPVAAFLESGGKLRVSVQPSKPMPLASLAMTVMAAGMGGSPSQTIKDLGLKTEHSK